VAINQASVFELERVFQNRERAQEVINKRELLGDFQSWDDVQKRLTGVSDRAMRDLRSAGLTVGPEHPALGHAPVEERTSRRELGSRRAPRRGQRAGVRRSRPSHA
jgi:hypothetical protein